MNPIFAILVLLCGCSATVQPPRTQIHYDGNTVEYWKQGGVYVANLLHTNADGTVTRYINTQTFTNADGNVGCFKTEL